MDITRWSIPKSDWLHSLQLKMEKLYTVSKNKTRGWRWLRSWTPCCKVKVNVAQLCLTLCDAMDYTVYGILLARVLEWVAYPFIQGIFPTQESKQSLLHYRWILYQLSHIHNVVPPLQLISEYFYHALCSKKPSLIISHSLFPSTPSTLGHHE